MSSSDCGSYEVSSISSTSTDSESDSSEMDVEVEDIYPEGMGNYYSSAVGRGETFLPEDEMRASWADLEDEREELMEEKVVISNITDNRVKVTPSNGKLYCQGKIVGFYYSPYEKISFDIDSSKLDEAIALYGTKGYKSMSSVNPSFFLHQIVSIMIGLCNNSEGESYAEGRKWDLVMKGARGPKSSNIHLVEICSTIIQSKKRLGKYSSKISGHTIITISKYEMASVMKIPQRYAKWSKFCDSKDGKFPILKQMGATDQDLDILELITENNHTSQVSKSLERVLKSRYSSKIREKGPKRSYRKEFEKVGRFYNDCVKQSSKTKYLRFGKISSIERRTLSAEQPSFQDMYSKWDTSCIFKSKEVADVMSSETKNKGPDFFMGFKTTKSWNSHAISVDRNLMLVTDERLQERNNMISKKIKRNLIDGKPEFKRARIDSNLKLRLDRYSSNHTLVSDSGGFEKKEFSIEKFLHTVTCSPQTDFTSPELQEVVKQMNGVSELPNLDNVNAILSTLEQYAEARFLNHISKIILKHKKNTRSNERLLIPHPTRRLMAVCQVLGNISDGSPDSGVAEVFFVYKKADSSIPGMCHCSSGFNVPEFDYKVLGLTHRSRIYTFRKPDLKWFIGLPYQIRGLISNMDEDWPDSKRLQVAIPLISILCQGSWGLSKVLKPFQFVVTSLMSGKSVSEPLKKMRKEVTGGGQYVASKSPGLMLMLSYKFDWNVKRFRKNFRVVSSSPKNSWDFLFEKASLGEYQEVIKSAPTITSFLLQRRSRSKRGLTPFFQLDPKYSAWEEEIINLCPCDMYNMKRHVFQCTDEVAKEQKLARERKENLSYAQEDYKEKFKNIKNLKPSEVDSRMISHLKEMQQISDDSSERFVFSPVSLCIAVDSYEEKFEEVPVLEENFVVPPLDELLTRKGAYSVERMSNEKATGSFAEYLKTRENLKGSERTSMMCLLIDALEDNEYPLLMSLIAKQQTGGDREISMMSAAFRILQISTEWVARPIGIKTGVDVLDDKSKIQGYFNIFKDSKPTCVSVDRKRWGPNLSTRIFGMLMASISLKSGSGACFISSCSLFKLTSKAFVVDETYVFPLGCDHISENIYYKGNLYRVIKVDHHMGQGITHYNSSLWHALVIMFFIKNVSSITAGRIRTMGSFVTSDDGFYWFNESLRKNKRWYWIQKCFCDIMHSFCVFASIINNDYKEKVSDSYADFNSVKICTSDEGSVLVRPTMKQTVGLIGAPCLGSPILEEQETKSCFKTALDSGLTVRSSYNVYLLKTVAWWERWGVMGSETMKRSFRPLSLCDLISDCNSPPSLVYDGDRGSVMMSGVKYNMFKKIVRQNQVNDMLYCADLCPNVFPVAKSKTEMLIKADSLINDPSGSRPYNQFSIPLGILGKEYMHEIPDKMKEKYNIDEKQKITVRLAMKIYSESIQESVESSGKLSDEVSKMWNQMKRSTNLDVSWINRWRNDHRSLSPTDFKVGTGIRRVKASRAYEIRWLRRYRGVYVRSLFKLKTLKNEMSMDLFNKIDELTKGDFFEGYKLSKTVEKVYDICSSQSCLRIRGNAPGGDPSGHNMLMCNMGSESVVSAYSKNKVRRLVVSSGNSYLRAESTDFFKSRVQPKMCENKLSVCRSGPNGFIKYVIHEGSIEVNKFGKCIDSFPDIWGVTKQTTQESMSCFTEEGFTSIRGITYRTSAGLRKYGKLKFKGSQFLTSLKSILKRGQSTERCNVWVRRAEGEAVTEYSITSANDFEISKFQKSLHTNLMEDGECMFRCLREFDEVRAFCMSIAGGYLDRALFKKLMIDDGLIEVLGLAFRDLEGKYHVCDEDVAVFIAKATKVRGGNAPKVGSNLSRCVQWPHHSEKVIAKTQNTLILSPEQEYEIREIVDRVSLSEELSDEQCLNLMGYIFSISSWSVTF